MLSRYSLRNPLRILPQAGECIRRLHATRRLRADGKDETTSPMAPKRGRTRQERAAMVSEEVKMLHRESPTPTRETGSTTVAAGGAGSGKQVDAVKIHQDIVEEPVAEEIDVEKPADATPVVIPTQLSDAESTRDDTVAAPTSTSTADDVLTMQETDTPSFEALPELDLSQTKFGPATLAGSGAENIVLQRISDVAATGLPGVFRDPAYLARRLMSNKLVEFESVEEKAEVEELAKQIAKGRQQKEWRAKHDKTKTPPHTVAPISSKARQRVVDHLVAGKYEQPWLEQKFKLNTPVLRDIAKAATMNDTYLKSDRERFLNKLITLLPAPVKPAAKKPTSKAATR